MGDSRRPAAFWVICPFLVVSLIFLLMGQTSAIFAYDWAVSVGLQESIEDISGYGVAVNRAFGVGDTIVYVPLVVLALIGLSRRARWSLPVTGAVMGISAYWAATTLFMLLLLPGAPGYSMEPGAVYWAVLGFYIIVGVWGIFYLAVHGDRLVGHCGES